MIESFPTFRQLFVRNQEIFVESSSPLSGAGFIVDVILCFQFFFFLTSICLFSAILLFAKNKGTNVAELSINFKWNLLHYLF